MKEYLEALAPHIIEGDYSHFDLMEITKREKMWERDRELAVLDEDAACKRIYNYLYSFIKELPGNRKWQIKTLGRAQGIFWIGVTAPHIRLEAKIG